MKSTAFCRKSTAAGILLSATLLGAGCSSLVARNKTLYQAKPQPYPGVRYWPGVAQRMLDFRKNRIIYTYAPEILALDVAVLAVDLPCSLVTDSVLLPYDLMNRPSPSPVVTDHHSTEGCE